MKDRTFNQAKPSPLTIKGYPRTEIAISLYKPPETTRLPAICWPLTEPILQNLGHDARFLIDYFVRRVCPLLTLSDCARNPYQEMIPLIGSSKAVANAIMAVAACHCIHDMIGYPVFSPADHMLGSRTSIFQKYPKPDLNIAESGMLKRYILLKQNSLSQLSETLSNLQGFAEIEAFVAAVLLTLLELVETGAGSWSTHLEGAKRLVDITLHGSQHLNPPLMLESLISDLDLIDTLGSTLVPPGALTSPLHLRSRLNNARESSHVTSIGCPPELYQAIHFISAQRRRESQPDESSLILLHVSVDTQAVRDKLHQIRCFDLQAWASSITGANTTSAQIEHAAQMQIALIWKLAADIYASRIFYTLTKDTDFVMPSVSDLIREYDFLEEDDALLKCLIWPTFMAGAESTCPEHREWALRKFDRIWRITLSANSKNAKWVLMSLWEKHDKHKQQPETQVVDDWDWIAELSSLDSHWIFF